MAELVHELFSNYYAECFEQVHVPSSLESREFGAMLLGQRVMVRHKSLKDPSAVRDFLHSLVPSDVYYSVAYYERPEAAEMAEKGWVGSDLVFDIDADHIPTTCGKTHDEWTCVKCSFSGRGIIPDSCPLCGAERFEAKTWPCEICIYSAKQETIKLLDVLTNDFGISKKDVDVFFSGHRGYHIHIENELIRELDSTARKEIVDFVTALGYDPRTKGLTKLNASQSDILKNLRLSDSGWNGRVARGTRAFVISAHQSDYETLGLGGSVANILVDNKDRLVKSWDTLGSLSPIKGVGVRTWEKILKHSISCQTSRIDTVVTTDIHRLIRLGGSLHGKTGLKKVKLETSSIDSFDPFRSAIAFKNGAVTVHISNAPEFRIGEETFGPYSEQTVTLPTAAALLLVCKNRAKVVE